MKEEVVLRVCRLCESRASLMKEEVVVKVCRLRKSRASLEKGACHQSLSAARVRRPACSNGGGDYAGSGCYSPASSLAD